jgi:hypothetical protein
MTQSPISAMGDRQLREFGIITGLLIIVLVGGLVPWIWDRSILEWQRFTGPLGGALILWGLLHPSSLIYLYRPWMWLAEKVGWINTRIILFLLFYVIIFPTGIIMRLFGHDPMARRLRPLLDSYRVEKKAENKDHMETPF